MDALPQTTPRVHQMDALRGVAVLMILLVNIFAFGYPLEVSEQAGLSDSMSLLSQLQHQLYELLIHGKLISLLTLLFGASLYLLWQQSHGAETKLKARMSALLLIGFCHCVFVWSGDVLLMYASVASGLLWQRVQHWTPEHQLRYAKHYLTAGLVLPTLVWLLPSGQTEEPADTAKLIALYTGPYSDQVWHQLKYVGLVALDLLFISYWWFGGMMLLAIWAIQSDWQQLLKNHFVTLLLIAFGCGLLPMLWTGFAATDPTLHPLHMISDLCFALIYIRLFIFVIPLFPAFLELLRRCGRCSLSLYLWQSVTMVLLFRWVYPELFGLLDRPSLTTIAFILITLQLLCVHYFYKAGQLWWFEQLYRWLSLKLERRAQDTAA
ncbi:DUF418 domain-containing protein [Rheinheimera faecalis]|uniref:DUF418 domain-containing protein n=1 Tax=Rheinheimera faecalis TaxID=2901141 RepID=UPI001E5EB57F|nr:DUF418 domain-containing protein [Rheinheimera faecalis]